MNDYKQKALDHVRSVCPELTCSACDGDGILVVPDPHDPSGNTPMQQQCNYCAATGMANTPHLEHFTKGVISSKSWKGKLVADQAKNFFNLVMYWDNTKDGENQSEEFYRSYCDIIGI